MMDDVEQIEAKLCAYVDGELTGPEREEIERHLAAHPSHQALVRDLMAQRRLLRQLPRESAPPDLGDPLQMQLEREALLGGEPFLEASEALQVRRWPQYLAAAAIVLLALGLGVIVYFVLPPKHPVLVINTGDEVAAVQEQPTSQPAETMALAGVKGTKAEIAGDLPAAARTDESDFLAAKPTLDVAAGTLALVDEKTGANGAITLNTHDFFRESPAAETLVITVQAADVKVINEELVSYLSANNIAWSAAHAQVLARAEPMLPQAYGEASMEAPVAARDLSPAPVAAIAGRGRAVDGDAAVSSGMIARNHVQLVRSERVILARNLNTHQLTELTTALAQSPRVQQGQASSPVAFHYSKVHLSQTQPVVPQVMVHRGIEVAATLPSTQPAAPPLALGVPVQVATQPASPAGEPIVAEKLALLGDRHLGSAPSTQAIGEPERYRALGRFPMMAPATQPMTQPVVDFAVTTQPVGGFFNCVIVLADSDGTAPATQPAEGPTLAVPATLPAVEGSEAEQVR